MDGICTASSAAAEVVNMTLMLNLMNMWQANRVAVDRKIVRRPRCGEKARNRRRPSERNAHW
jgi:hypothetical protein